MMQCWSFNLRDRPIFQSLVLKLSHILKRESSYLDLSSSLHWKNDSEQISSTPLIDEVKNKDVETNINKNEDLTIIFNIARWLHEQNLVILTNMRHIIFSVHKVFQLFHIFYSSISM